MEGGINRRSVMKTVGGIGISQAFLADVEAAESSASIGKTHVVESVLVHEGIDEGHNHVDRHESPLIVEPDEGRATLTTAPVSAFRREFVSAFRGNYHRSGDQVKRSQSRSLIVGDSFDHPSRTTARTANDYVPPSFAVSRNSQTVTLEADGRRIEVPVGATESLRLSDQEVTLGDDTSKTVTPIVRTRNHGVLDVYGREGARTYPLDTDVTWARLRANHYLHVASQDPHVSVEKADEFLVVDIDA